MLIEEPKKRNNRNMTEEEFIDFIQNEFRVKLVEPQRALLRELYKKTMKKKIVFEVPEDFKDDLKIAH